MKLLRTLLASAALLLATGMAQAAQPARVIPAVQDMTAVDGTLTLPPSLIIAYPQELEGEGTRRAKATPPSASAWSPASASRKNTDTRSAFPIRVSASPPKTPPAYSTAYRPCGSW